MHPCYIWPIIKAGHANLQSSITFFSPICFCYLNSAAPFSPLFSLNILDASSHLAQQKDSGTKQKSIYPFRTSGSVWGHRPSTGVQLRYDSPISAEIHNTLEGITRYWRASHLSNLKLLSQWHFRPNVHCLFWQALLGKLGSQASPSCSCLLFCSSRGYSTYSPITACQLSRNAGYVSRPLLRYLCPPRLEFSGWAAGISGSTTSACLRLQQNLSHYIFGSDARWGPRHGFCSGNGSEQIICKVFEKISTKGIIFLQTSCNESEIAIPCTGRIAKGGHSLTILGPIQQQTQYLTDTPIGLLTEQVYNLQGSSPIRKLFQNVNLILKEKKRIGVV